MIAARSEKAPPPSVRHRNSLLCCSIAGYCSRSASYLTQEGGEVLDVLQCLVQVGRRCRDAASSTATWAYWERTKGTSGCSKIARIRGPPPTAARPWWPGSGVAALHRCQEAQGNAVAIIPRSPWWKPEATSYTAARPRAASPRKNASRPAPSSAIAAPRPRIYRLPPHRRR